MDTIVSEIAKTRMMKDVNDALTAYGLSVSNIRFDSSVDFSVILELSVQGLSETKKSKNKAVPEGTAC
ncbi:MAG: hypothetical protein GX027_04065 [Clostridiaceae bacterium]|jgi:hypothetical protein|nr:hypothetical protein [Clostridiaceae bacterium]